MSTALPHAPDCMCPNCVLVRDSTAPDIPKTSYETKTMRFEAVEVFKEERDYHYWLVRYKKTTKPYYDRNAKQWLPEFTDPDLGWMTVDNWNKYANRPDNYA